MVKDRDDNNEDQDRLENVLLSQYLDELRQKNSSGVKKEKSPYQQKLAHTNIIPLPNCVVNQLKRKPKSSTPSVYHSQLSSGHLSRSGSQSRGFHDNDNHSHSASGAGMDGRESRQGDRMDLVIIDASEDNGHRDSAHIEDNRPETAMDRDTPSTRHRNRPGSAPNGRRSSSPSASLPIMSERQNRRPVTAFRKRKKKPMYLRQPGVLVAIAFRNGSREDYCRVTAPSFLLLLEKATTSLHLPSAARRAFLSNGMEIKKPSDIPREAEIYVSMGEGFRDPFQPIKETQLLKEGANWTMNGVVLPPDRPRKATKPHLSKRFSEKNEWKKRRVVVYKNGGGLEAIEVVVDMEDMHGFLEACTSKFNMGSHIRKVYLWDDTPIENLYELPDLETILQEGGGTPVLGPVWVTKGEGLSPSGVEQYLNEIIKMLSEKRATSNHYNQQLQSAKDGKKEEVAIASILSLSEAELDEAIEHVHRDLDKYNRAIKSYKDRLKKVSPEAHIEREEGSKYTMKHIEVCTKSTLMGKQGYKLYVYENGDCKDKTEVYFNIQEASRGVKDRKEVLNRFLDHCSNNMRLASKNNQARGILARKIYNDQGKEITDVFSLQNEQELWLSHGEPWIDPFICCLSVEFDAVKQMEHKGRSFVIREDFSGHVFQGMERPGTWETVYGVPSEVETREAPEELEDDQPPLAIGSDHTFLQCKKVPELVIYGEPVVSHKQRPGNKMLWPHGTLSQVWTLDLDGRISPKCQPGLALSLTHSPISGTMVKEECRVTGYMVDLLTKTSNDTRQQWKFKTDGYLYNMADLNLVLTYLGGHSEDSETMVINENGGIPCSLRNYVAACEVLDAKNDKFQRWAIKQERFDILGQWKCSTVRNPEWNKYAYSWPMTDGGEWNDKFIWPMEGYLIPLAPPLHPAKKDTKLSGTGSKRLYVLKNGERDPSRATTVNGPDLSNLIKDKALAKKKKVKSSHHVEEMAMDEGLASPSGQDSIQDEYMHCSDITFMELEFKLFMERCTGLLNLRSAARRLFDSNGMEHFTLKDLARDELVYVSTGELWSNPLVTKEEMRRRALLCKLADDVDKMRHFIELRDPQGFVVSVESGLACGASLVVLPQYHTKHSGKRRGVSCSSDSDESDEDDDPSKKMTAHQRACKAADSRQQNKVKWPWEKLVDGIDDQAADSFDDQKKSPRKSAHYNPKNLQRFGYEDDFIYSLADPDLVFTVMDSQAHVLDVVLDKKKMENTGQRWIIKPNGLILSKYRKEMVLTVQLPKPCPTAPQMPLSYPSAKLTLQPNKLTQFGRANQMFFFNPSKAILLAFYSSIVDKEVTAANAVNVCTFSIINEEIDQLGYRAFLPLKDGKVKGFYACVACARSLRGRYKLQKIRPGTVDFRCCFGEARKLGIQEKGSFRCLDGKVQLSTPEAIHTLTYWESTIHNIKEELSVKKLENKIADVRTPRPIKLLVYRNGEARLSLPERITATSLEGIREQAGHRLALNKPVRTLYTEDGYPILELDDLYSWYLSNRAKVHKRFAEVQAGNMAPELDQIKKQVMDETNQEEADGEAKDRANDAALVAKLNEDKGYYEIGPLEKKTEVYEISITITMLTKLRKLIPPEQLGNPACKFVLIYNLFDVEIATDVFSNEEDFEAEKTTVRIRCRLDILRNYIAKVMPFLRIRFLPIGQVDPSDPESGLQLGDEVGYTDIALSFLTPPDCSTLPRPVSLEAIYPLHKPMLDPSVPGEKTRAALCAQLRLVKEEAEDGDDSTVQGNITGETNLTEGEETTVADFMDNDMVSAEEEISNIMIELWASVGEQFVPLKKVYQDYKQMLRDRALKGELINQLDTERHVLRHMQARRFESMNPGEFQSTVNQDNPVLIYNNWQNTPSNEMARQQNIEELEDKLHAVHKYKRTPTTLTTVDLNRDLYRQPLLKRVRIYPNGEETKLAAHVWGETLDQLMENASTRLNFQKRPKYLFDTQGQQITNFDDLEKDQLICLSAGDSYLPPKTSRQNVEIRANWGRARRLYGPKSTEIIVRHRPNGLVGVDPFGPPALAKKHDPYKIFETKRISVFENGKNKDTACVIWGDSMDSLLKLATRKLHLRKEAVCFYAPDGKKIEDFEEIVRDDLLIASTCGKGIIKM